jgi:hypothetical protein
LFSNFEVENWQVLPKEKIAHLVKIRLKRKTTILPKFFSRVCQGAQICPTKKNTHYPDFATDI